MFVFQVEVGALSASPSWPFKPADGADGTGILALDTAPLIQQPSFLDISFEEDWILISCTLMYVDSTIKEKKTLEQVTTILLYIVWSIGILSSIETHYRKRKAWEYGTYRQDSRGISFQRTESCQSVTATGCFTDA